MKKVNRNHASPLPSKFVPSMQDGFEDNVKSIQMQQEYNVEYMSCIGALIYLSYTRPDIIFAINKIGKFTKNPGVAHMKVLMHLLWYSRENTNIGVKYYSDVTSCPVINETKG